MVVMSTYKLSKDVTLFNAKHAKIFFFPLLFYAVSMLEHFDFRTAVSNTTLIAQRQAEALLHSFFEIKFI